jgi:RNA polymerase sigma-70 factor (ECF subfamily)
LRSACHAPRTENGETGPPYAIGVVMAPRGRLVRALRFTIANGKITEIEVIGDPARLGELEVSIVD